MDTVFDIFGTNVTAGQLAMSIGLNRTQLIALNLSIEAYQDRPPSILVWFNMLSSVMTAFFIVACVCYGVIVILSMKFIYDICTKVHNEFFKGDLYVLLLTPAYLGTISMLSLIFPRAAQILYCLAILYAVYALYTVFLIVARLFGGCESVSYWLVANDLKITLGIGPCCCLRRFSLEPTVENIHRLLFLVRLLPIVHVVIEVIQIIIYLEDFETTRILTILHAISSVTMGISLMSCLIFVHSVLPAIRPYSIVTIFAGIKVCDGLFTLIKTILDGIGDRNQIGTPSGISSTVAANFWFNVVVLILMCPIVVLWVILLRPSKCAFYNLEKAPRCNDFRVKQK